jgi:predicted DNA-binding protein
MIKKNVFKRVDYHLTMVQYNRLKELAEKTSVSVAAHIRMAVDKYLNDKGRE